MGKKCIPGLICIENMTLFILFVVSVITIYVYYVYIVKLPKDTNNTKVIIVSPLTSSRETSILGGVATRNDILNDPYSPPLKSDGYYTQRNSSDIRSVPPISPPIQVPVNIETRGLSSQYSQLGILTKKDNQDNKRQNNREDRDRDNGNSDNLILPLMGRRHMTGRDKWQYYSISNTGSMNTKLPIRVNGKSCTSEYGCDPIMNGDVVYVEGYKTTFQATIYENNIFQYLPF
jgi:hypothetical protein